MKRKFVKVMACATVLTMAMALSACGGSSDDASSEDASQEETEGEAEEESAGEYTVSYGVIYNEDEELEYEVPFNPIGSANAESMMQVTGYDWTFVPVDDANYELTLSYTCGEPGEDTAMYMKRTYVFGGTYTADGDTYTLDAAATLNFSQETGGQFAATSGEGGADFWGPDGLEFDETYANEDGYNGCNASDIMAAFSPCKVNVSGSEIVSFELQ